MTDTPRSEKHELARNSLPDDLKPVFDDFVTDYRFAATKHHGSPFVSYIVLAEMVKLGWRLGAEPMKDHLDSKASDQNRPHDRPR